MSQSLSFIYSSYLTNPFPEIRFLFGAGGTYDVFAFLNSFPSALFLLHRQCSTTTIVMYAQPYRGKKVRLFARNILKIPLYGCLGLACLATLPTAAFCQDQTAPATTPDNSANNKAHSNTAEQQSEATSDRMLTKKIRQSLVADKSLSTYAHNVKIITKDGMVTLKGPVHSEDEKSAIASKAAEVAGSSDKITNQ